MGSEEQVVEKMPMYGASEQGQKLDFVLVLDTFRTAF